MRLAIAILALLTAFPPLSIDMILPALPSMAATWGEPLSRINLVLISFFLTYAGALLVYGPVSDRFGRRGPLLAGLGLYVAASIVCGLSESVDALVFGRVLQAAGAASASSMAMAMSKDFFSGKERERVLAVIGIIMALAPMLAPSVGGFVLAVGEWPWIFYTQAAIGVAAMAGSFALPRVAIVPAPLSAMGVARAYGRLLTNRGYMTLTLLMALCLFPLYGFIASSGDIYINGFGLSEQVFGYYFALNALCLMAGSYGCLRLVKVFDSTHLITAGFVGAAAGGAVMLAGLDFGLRGFVPAMALIAFCCGLSRPPSNNLILEQVDRDAGAASSLLLFLFFGLGSGAMHLASLDWEMRRAMLGTMALVCGSLSLLGWLVVKRRLVRGVEG